MTCAHVVDVALKTGSIDPFIALRMHSSSKFADRFTETMSKANRYSGSSWIQWYGKTCLWRKLRWLPWQPASSLTSMPLPAEMPAPSDVYCLSRSRHVEGGSVGAEESGLPGLKQRKQGLAGQDWQVFGGGYVWKKENKADHTPE